MVARTVFVLLLAPAVAWAQLAAESQAQVDACRDQCWKKHHPCHRGKKAGNCVEPAGGLACGDPKFRAARAEWCAAEAQMRQCDVQCDGLAKRLVQETAARAQTAEVEERRRLSAALETARCDADSLCRAERKRREEEQRRLEEERQRAEEERRRIEEEQRRAEEQRLRREEEEERRRERQAALEADEREQRRQERHQADMEAIEQDRQAANRALDEQRQQSWSDLQRGMESSRRQMDSIHQGVLEAQRQERERQERADAEERRRQEQRRAADEARRAQARLEEDRRRQEQQRIEADRQQEALAKQRVEEERRQQAERQQVEAAREANACHDRTRCLKGKSSAPKGPGDCEGAVLGHFRNECNERIECTICPVDRAGRIWHNKCHQSTFSPGEKEGGWLDGQWWCGIADQFGGFRSRCSLPDDPYACRAHR